MDIYIYEDWIIIKTDNTCIWNWCYNVLKAFLNIRDSLDNVWQQREMMNEVDRFIHLFAIGLLRNVLNSWHTHVKGIVEASKEGEFLTPRNRDWDWPWLQGHLLTDTVVQEDLSWIQKNTVPCAL